MINIYFPDEEIKKNDVYFICYMIERVARKLHQRNCYVVNQIGKPNLEHLISVANVLHAENPLAVEDDWIREYHLTEGDTDVTAVNPELVEKIPSAIQMGKVYQRLIFDTLQPRESEVEAIIRVYNDEICEVIDNYNCSAYYEPSYVIARAYQNGGFKRHSGFCEAKPPVQNDGSPAFSPSLCRTRRIRSGFPSVRDFPVFAKHKVILRKMKLQEEIFPLFLLQYDILVQRCGINGQYSA